METYIPNDEGTYFGNFFKYHFLWYDHKVQGRVATHFEVGGPNWNTQSLLPSLFLHARTCTLQLWSKEIRFLWSVHSKLEPGILSFSLRSYIKRNKLW